MKIEEKQQANQDMVKEIESEIYGVRKETRHE